MVSQTYSGSKAVAGGSDGIYLERLAGECPGYGDARERRRRSQKTIAA